MSLYQTGVRQVIDDHLIAESKKIRDYGKYWSASSAGYCMRRNIFERMKVPHSTEDDPRKQRVFSAGHIFHDWIQGLTKEAGISIAQEVELQDEELMIRGHFDDLVLIKDDAELKEWRGRDMPYGHPQTPNIKQNLILYDYKTVNSRSFLWAKKNGNAMSYYHRLQLGTYMYMLRNRASAIFKVTNTSLYEGLEEMLPDLTEARILKIEKENLMMMEQKLLWTPELEAEVLNYWRTLNKYWAEKKIPPCTCADHEGGFLAKPQYNPFYFNDEPCSLDWYKKFKESQNEKATA